MQWLKSKFKAASAVSYSLIFWKIDSVSFSNWVFKQLLCLVSECDPPTNNVCHTSEKWWCSKIITSFLIKTSAKTDEPPKPQQSAKAGEPGIEVAALALERRPAPSLAELDSSSSFSSMDEDNDSDSDPESMIQTQLHTYQRPPLVRSQGRGGLHRMSEAFVCFFAPDKRLTRLVEELSRDRRSIFGGMVQDFLLEQREVLKTLASASSSSSSSSRVTSVQLLQGLRLFLSQAKCCLLDSGELEPPIETLVPESEKGKQTETW